MTRNAIWAAAIFATACASGQEQSDYSSGTAELQASASFGDPIPGLTATQLAAFNTGRGKFQEVEGVADGLGPVFNEASCVACHAGPAVGGTNQRLETRFGKLDAQGNFDPMAYAGGSLLQDHGIGVANGVDFLAEAIPQAATIVARRRTTPLFGLGLVDAVPDEELRALARLQALLTPASAGTANVVTNLSTNGPAIGKLGWKCQNPTLFQFAGDAYLNEMGITNPQFPNENCPQGDCSLLAANPKPGLNDDGTDVRAFTDFMRGLAPPPRGKVTLQAHLGEAVALSTGCLDCHVPTLFTGATDIAALAHKAFHPYSDLLLHDMGSLGDGIVQGNAKGPELRTTPLWGLRVQTALLHDGRAATIEQAVLAHDGQGRKARDKFAALHSSERAALLAFLESL